MYHLYIIETETGSYYTGITQNLEKRFQQHKSLKGAQYTSRYAKIKLAYSEIFRNRIEAEKRERQIKGWSKAKKRALIDQDFDLLKKLSNNPEVGER